MKCPFIYRGPLVARRHLTLRRRETPPPSPFPLLHGTLAVSLWDHKKFLLIGKQDRDKSLLVSFGCTLNLFMALRPLIISSSTNVKIPVWQVWVSDPAFYVAEKAPFITSWSNMHHHTLSLPKLAASNEQNSMARLYTNQIIRLSLSGVYFKLIFTCGGVAGWKRGL